MPSFRGGSGVTHCLTYNNKVLCNNQRGAIAVKRDSFDAILVEPLGEKQCARCAAKRQKELARLRYTAA